MPKQDEINVYPRRNEIIYAWIIITGLGSLKQSNITITN